MIKKRIIFALARLGVVLGGFFTWALLMGNCGGCGEPPCGGTIELKKSYVTLAVDRNSCARYSAPHQLLQNGNASTNPFKLLVKVQILNRQNGDPSFATCLDAWSAGRLSGSRIYNQISHDFSANFDANGGYNSSGLRTYLFDSRSYSGLSSTPCVIAIPQNRQFRIIAYLIAPCEECIRQQAFTTILMRYISRVYNDANDYENNSSSGSIPYNVTWVLTPVGGLSNPTFYPCALDNTCEE